MELSDYAKMYVPMRAAARRAMENFPRKGYQRQRRRRIYVNKAFRTEQDDKSVFNVNDCNRTLWNSSIRRCVTHFTLPSPVKKSALALGVRCSFLRGTEVIPEPVTVTKQELNEDYPPKELVIKEEPTSPLLGSLVVKYEFPTDGELSYGTLATVKDENAMPVVKQEPADEFCVQRNLLEDNVVKQEPADEFCVQWNLPEDDVVKQSQYEHERAHIPISCKEQSPLSKENICTFDEVVNNDSLLHDLARIVQLYKAISLIKDYLILSDCPCDPQECFGAAHRGSLGDF